MTSQFTRAQGNEHSSAVHWLCHECATHIFSTWAEYFDWDYNWADLDEFKALLRPALGSHKFPTFAPVLYPPGSSMDSQKIFWTLILVNVRLPFVFMYLPIWLQWFHILKAILNGASSLTGGNSVAKPKTMSKLWGLTGVTAGSISLATILVGIHFIIWSCSLLKLTSLKLSIIWRVKSRRRKGWFFEVALPKNFCHLHIIL